MNRSYQVEGLVVRVSKAGETDSRLTLLTRHQGKIVVLARGLRKLTSRKAPYLDLFNHAQVFLAKGKNNDIVTDVKPINSFPNLRKDLLRVACAFKLIELVARLLPERENHLNIFARLLSEFTRLNKPGILDEKNMLKDFSNFLLSELGYKEKYVNFSDRELDILLEDAMEKKINTNQLLQKLI